MSIIPGNFFGGRRSNVIDPFTHDVWGPSKDFPFETALKAPHPPFSNETTSFANARIDWKETPEAHVFKADLPGLRKDEVKLQVVEAGVLQISGERSLEKVEKNEKWHRVERSSGKFLRQFKLPENAQVDQIRAIMENGVLTITVPKMELKIPHVRAIDISG